MGSKPRKPFDGIGRPSMMSVNEIYGSDKESKKMANKVFDRIGIPTDYRAQYIAEKDLKGQAKKYLRTKNSNTKKQMKQLLQHLNNDNSGRGKNKSDAWKKNDEFLYKVMGGKNKTKYDEDQATYREFGRTYGGPTDAASPAMRKRREAGNYSFGEKPKKKAGKRGKY